MAKKIRVTKKEIEELNGKKQIVEDTNNKKTEKNYDILKILSVILNGTLIIVILFIISSYEDKVARVEMEKDAIDTTCAYKNDSDCTLKYSTEINKANFLDENIVFVLKGYGNVYYTYDCVKKITSGSYSYWAYNKEAAIGKGYQEAKC